MNEILFWILSLVAGLALGIIFFGGLWLTVKKTVRTRKPALWIFGSFFIRVAITLTGFYFISQADWKRIVIALLGFVIARYCVIRYTRQNEEKLLRVKKETGYES